MEELEAEDLLPGGLPGALGDYLANGNFAGVDLSFFAPVLGPDINIDDMADLAGDDDSFDDSDDDDDGYDAGDDGAEADRIFVHLQDSRVMRRLSYHKGRQVKQEDDDGYRLPRAAAATAAAGGETDAFGSSYEELYRLLEELELLLKTWRRRLAHPYTAHITRQAPSPPPANDQEASDYEASDYEYDSDEERIQGQRRTGMVVNESLTKKRFCHSVKAYHEIFESERQLNTFQRYIFRTRKNIFVIVFELFMDALPDETARRLPRELWEKVWKFSQNSQIRLGGGRPMSTDTSYYRAGLRAQTLGDTLLEKERIRDLFAAVGNLHMMVFEVLFKTPSILQPSPLCELEGLASRASFVRSTFWHFVGLLKQKAARLEALEPYFSRSDDAAKDTTTTSGLEQQLAQGAFLVQDHNLEDCKVKGLVLDPASSVVTSEGYCKLVLIPGRYPLQGEDSGLCFVVYNVTTGKVVDIFKTGIDYKYHLFDVASQKVQRMGLLAERSDWKQHICITNSMVSYVFHDAADTYTVYTWRMFGDRKPLPPPQPLAVVRLKTTDKTVYSVRHDYNYVALMVCGGGKSRLTVYIDFNSKCVTDHEWPGEDMCLAGVQNGLALVIGGGGKAVLFDLREDYQVDLGGLLAGASGPLAGLFDVDQQRKQFAIVSRTGGDVWLGSYTTEIGAKPSAAVEHFSGGDDGGLAAVCRNPSGFRLKDGVLVYNGGCELGGDGGSSSHMYGSQAVGCHLLAAHGLTSRTSHCVLKMAARQSDLGRPLMNELSPRWLDPLAAATASADLLEAGGGRFEPDRRPVFFVNATTFGVLLEDRTLRLFDTSLPVVEVARKESKQLAPPSPPPPNRTEKTAGILKEWHHTYGFLYETSSFPRIFVHKKDIVNYGEWRTRIKPGVRMFFEKVPGRHLDSWQAVKADIFSVGLSRREVGEERRKRELEEGFDYNNFYDD